MPISLEAKEIPGIANGERNGGDVDGRVVSDLQKERRTFTYAVVAHPPDIYKGGNEVQTPALERIRATLCLFPWVTCRSIPTGLQSSSDDAPSS